MLHAYAYPRKMRSGQAWGKEHALLSAAEMGLNGDLCVCLLPRKAGQVVGGEDERKASANAHLLPILPNIYVSQLVILIYIYISVRCMPGHVTCLQRKRREEEEGGNH